MTKESQNYRLDATSANENGDGLGEELCGRVQAQKKILAVAEPGPGPGRPLQQLPDSSDHHLLRIQIFFE